MAAKNDNSAELCLTRVYDAPVKLVWDAWTDPEKVKQWWGPRGFTLTHHSKDLRVGGNWRYTMHGPDGTDYPNVTLYHEVVPLKRLVYDHGATDKTPPLFRVTVEFSDLGGKTKMDMTMAFESPQAAREIGAFIKKAGGNATWDRLAEFLTEKTTGKEVFVIHRSFQAPIEKVFQVWTDPKHVAQWLPPKGFTMTYLHADIRPGGKSKYKMTDGDKVTMFGRAEYLEVKAPNRLVYTQQFCTEDDQISRHPLAPTWPETMLTTVTFTSEGPAATRVSVYWEVTGPASQEELDTFRKGRSGMTIGWTGSFDKLEAYLET